ncbi:MAG: hypothetical protein R2771_15530 [Saprospiraceae bacterium]
MSVIFLISQPDFSNELIIKLYENIFWIILGFIFLGFVFMANRNPSLVYYSFISAVILTFYLKAISNRQLILPTEHVGDKAFEILHFNTFDYEGNQINILKEVFKNSADIVSFGELTPGMTQYLKENLISKYPYSAELFRIDYDSKLILSKYPILSVDTFYLSGHPQLNISFNSKG